MSNANKEAVGLIPALELASLTLIVRRPLQSVNGICFCVDQKELTPELLFKVGLGSNWEDANVCLLAKEVLGLVTVVPWTSSHILYGLLLYQKGDISKATC